ncbi:MAG: hypothetical protein FWH23_06570 [Bacteroidales bacterium]|nr:hypothetical protein [Bacteroidales bacterium]MCL2133740.1 hypothetical protein [Bacteroidales bacterium]
MKKLFTFIAVAVLAVACCNQQPASTSLNVAKFFEDPIALVDQEITIDAVIEGICFSTGNFIIGTGDQQIMVAPPAEQKVCKGAIGKEFTIKGVVNAFTVTEEFVADFEAQIEEMECPEGKEVCQQKLADWKAKLEVGEFPIYSIAAAEITPKDGCCKDGKKEGCCKDGEKEGCEKKCADKEGEGCEKKCDKKAEGCEKAEQEKVEE